MFIETELVRWWLNYFTTAANATTQSFTFTNSSDDYRVRHVKGLFVGITTAGVSVIVNVNGQDLIYIDCTRFSAADPVVPFVVDVPAKIQPTIKLANIAAGALTNVPVMLLYTVDPGSGQ